MSHDEKTFEPLDVPVNPKDKEFCLSFDQKDVEGYKEFFDKYGFVVIRNVLTESEVDDTVDEIWNEAKPASRNDPNTWNSKYNWPGSDSIGIFGSSSCKGKFAIKNRIKPVMYEIYKNIIGRPDLWVSFDRFGVMKPTKQVTLADGTKRDFPEYKSKEKWLHWDMNPFKITDKELNVEQSDGGESEMTEKDFSEMFFICERNGVVGGYKRVQGLVALTDATEEDGGFLTIPGFTNNLQQWSKFHQTTQVGKEISKTADFIKVPEGDPMNKQAKKITVRSGSLLIWDSRQPHCNFSNNSDKFRMVQYIKMFPARNEKDVKYAEFVRLRREKMNGYIERLKSESGDPLHLDNLSRKLLGLDSWY
ncbi:hypothetical protein AKO1_002855 [Acrasis kona]|uniref:Phytanoyl-CoA dioxygenase n=1 Tax=Acrasis kona TaxID=1008807 RepID=A0AAW2Z0Q4_9EUKA